MARKSERTDGRQRGAKQERGATREQVSDGPARAEKPREVPVIVGVGASAGGLEAFCELLRHLSATTGMAFVFVQHLDPKRESLLTSILPRSTSMPVLEVEDGMKIHENTVYVMPPRHDLSLSSDRFKLERRERPSTRPIDRFFRALAEESEGRAVGIILSGMQDDGSEGAEALKAAGAIVIAQDASARFDSMPVSAEATGCVDFVLPIAEIATRLHEIASNPLLAREPAERAEQDLAPPEVLPALFHLLRRTTGVDFSFYKQSTIRRRILRRMLFHRIDDLDSYIRLLRDSATELKALYDDLLINVTRFFRQADSFEALKEMVFPVIAKGKTHQNGIRAWVPGCSTGEQVYSLAIELLEFMEDNRPCSIQIFGTDISDDAIRQARSGFYPLSIQADVSADRLKKFFTKGDHGYQISRNVRELTIFARQNLAQDPPFSRLDLIYCSNVLIYMGSVLQKRIIPVFHYALQDNGFLVLGSSETVGNFSDLFVPVSTKHRMYSKKPSTGPSELEFHPTFSYPVPPPKAPQGPATTEPAAMADPTREAEGLLLSRYVPPGVLVDDRGDVVQFRGRTGHYLEPAPGPASTNLVKMAREGLAIELREALKKARASGEPQRKEGLSVRTNSHSLRVNLEVIPFKLQESGHRFFLVSFEETAPLSAVAPEGNRPSQPAPRGRNRLHVQELERIQAELKETREDLQAIIEEKEAANEELQAANEEIQSANEELQSTNEELQTAKEELQSTNEELTTINDELQNRNLELNEVNSDLTNLLSSINLPIVMLGRNLRIRRFTPTAEKVFNIIPTDVGRPLTDIKPNILVPDLQRIITDVIRRLTVHEQEVQDTDGRWYSMRIRPSQTADNKIDGAVITLVEVDDAHQVLVHQILDLRGQLGALLETVPAPILVLNDDLTVQSSNRRFREVFRMGAETIEGQSVYELEGGQWNVARLHQLLGQVLERHPSVEAFEIEHDFGEGDVRHLSINATRISGPDGKREIVMCLQPLVSAPSPTGTPTG